MEVQKVPHRYIKQTQEYKIKKRNEASIKNLEIANYIQKFRNILRHKCKYPFVKQDIIDLLNNEL